MQRLTIKSTINRKGTQQDEEIAYSHIINLNKNDPEFLYINTYGIDEDILDEMIERTKIEPNDIDYFKIATVEHENLVDQIYLCPRECPDELLNCIIQEYMDKDIEQLCYDMYQNHPELKEQDDHETLNETDHLKEEDENNYYYYLIPNFSSLYELPLSNGSVYENKNKKQLYLKTTNILHDFLDEEDNISDSTLVLDDVTKLFV